MNAVIKVGGKQYYVTEGSEIFVEKINANEGDEISFDQVLMVNGVVGTPTVKGAKVTAEVVKHGKQKKVLIYKYRAKKHTHKTQGHRQPYTKLVIKKIAA